MVPRMFVKDYSVLTTVSGTEDTVEKTDMGLTSQSFQAKCKIRGVHCNTQSYSKWGNQAHSSVAFLILAFFPLCSWESDTYLAGAGEKERETDTCHLQELFIISVSIHRTHLTIISPGHL